MMAIRRLLHRGLLDDDRTRHVNHDAVPAGACLSDPERLDDADRRVTRDQRQLHSDFGQFHDDAIGVVEREDLEIGFALESDHEPGGELSCCLRLLCRARDATRRDNGGLGGPS